MAERGLMLRDGAKYLSLAVPLGEYAPSGASAARLRTMFSAAGSRGRDGIRISFDVENVGGGVRGSDRRRGRRARPSRQSTAPLTRAHFELSGANELLVRRSVG
jgi:hypothetical protein